LGVEPLQQLDRDALPGDLPDAVVEPVVEVGVHHRLAVGDGGLGGAQPVQDHAALPDRDRLLDGHHPHPRTAVADPLDQSLRLQFDQCRTDAGPRHTEPLGEFVLHQPLGRCRLTVQDRLPQLRERMLFGLLSGARTGFLRRRCPPQAVR
jgi:hypothetical protein